MVVKMFKFTVSGPDNAYPAEYLYNTYLNENLMMLSQFLILLVLVISDGINI